ncbi:LacI family DNA-binding transcriptional regulator [Gryllotalpicola protaetiae]|uniref:LacI family transcriptional regulator n=1 Tax=Gryllotalpicola protaetiae TaxID=2419771 RepID=A0A387BIY2_9MICO|nr:LacI family DNA-binding transcriptional regulator [Gryllotalpicola protaetiae]AYG02648.1 LacI family transcriptional regulator [Gryllotalpicola protaetiae]
MPTPEPASRATLADVAARTGVAISTVSRALTRPERVNAATRERIAAAAAELGYTPNAAARALGSGRTRSIALLVSDVTNPFYFDIIRGAQQELGPAGYTPLLLDTEESEELEEAMLRRLRASYDGAIIAASRLTDRRLAELARTVPLVAINRQTRGVPSVFIDTPAGVEQVLEHLVSHGHRRVAYAAGPPTSWPNERRWRTFVAASERLGVAVSRVGPFEPRQSQGAAAADAVINTGATACLAFNDLLAIGMLRRFAERGVRVPDDLSVVGCDDIFGADFCHPPLTTITAPIAQAGRVAVSMLLAQLAGGASRRGVRLPTHLTIRASSGPAPGG